MRSLPDAPRFRPLEIRAGVWSTLGPCVCGRSSKRHEGRPSASGRDRRRKVDSDHRRGFATASRQGLANRKGRQQRNSKRARDGTDAPVSLGRGEAARAAVVQRTGHRSRSILTQTATRVPIPARDAAQGLYCWRRGIEVSGIADEKNGKGNAPRKRTGPGIPTGRGRSAAVKKYGKGALTVSSA